MNPSVRCSDHIPTNPECETLPFQKVDRLGISIQKDVEGADQFTLREMELQTKTSQAGLELHETRFRFYANTRGDRHASNRCSERQSFTAFL
jgi:hypothetical protein